MRKLAITAAVAAAAGIAAIPAFAATKTVNLVSSPDDKFSPSSITVKKNDRVKFVWKSGTHDVVDSDGKNKPWKDIGIRSGGSVTRKAAKKGTFRLECTLHSGMTFRVKVK